MEMVGTPFAGLCQAFKCQTVFPRCKGAIGKGTGSPSNVLLVMCRKRNDSLANTRPRGRGWSCRRLTCMSSIRFGPWALSAAFSALELRAS